MRKRERVMEVSDCSCSDELCIMNEAVIMIAEHLETENSSAAELQDFKTSQGRSYAGREKSDVKKRKKYIQT